MRVELGRALFCVVRFLSHRQGAMKNYISVALDAIAAARDAAAMANDAEEAEYHTGAVMKYREERKVAAAAEAEKPWWIDVGGESEPC